jgi:MoxR-like ATPase
LFESIEDVRERLTEQSYVSDKRLATVVFLATRLHKPILVEGPPASARQSSPSRSRGPRGASL